MKVLTCAQGSPEWHGARAGVITASMFTVARSRTGGLAEQQQKFADAYRGVAGGDPIRAAELAGYKDPVAKGRELLKNDRVVAVIDGRSIGEFSSAAKDYAFRLALERISGEPLDEGFETWQMRRGHELEPAARAAHEMDAGVVVQRCGFVLTDDDVFGCSADGFIGEDGGSEYKCLVSPERLRSVLVEEDLSEFADQCQGCLWITGRKYWHFAMYCPQLASIGAELWWREWKRDEDYIDAMQSDLLEFKELVDSYEFKLRQGSKKAA